MQYVTVQFHKYLPIPGQPNCVPFSCRQITHYTARIIVQHRLERQETPRDAVPAETVSCSWTRDPTRTVWHSVPEVELRHGALPCNMKQQQAWRANTDTGITSVGTLCCLTDFRNLRACLTGGGGFRSHPIVTLVLLGDAGQVMARWKAFNKRSQRT